MTARRACCLHPNCNLEKSFVPNKPCQLNAIPSGMSFVTLRWRRDENRFYGLEHTLRSGETFVISEVEEVRKQGHEVLVVPMHPRGSVLHTDAKPLLEYVCAQPLLSPPIAKGAAEAFVRAPHRTFRALSWLFRGRSAKVILKSLAVYPKGLWLARLAREWRADHIHAHWAATTASMALVASEFSRVPWSFTTHSGDILDWSFSAALPGAAKNALLSLKVSRACFVRFISRSGLRKAGLTETGASPKVFVLPMGVELPDLSAVRHEERRGRATVVCCPADFISVKGHKYLIKAVAILQERGLDLELWLAGKGGLEEELREQREALNLSNRIIFLGMLPHQRLMELYRRGEVDIVALPSVDLGGGEHEGIPVFANGSDELRRTRGVHDHRRYSRALGWRCRGYGATRRSHGLSRSHR